MANPSGVALVRVIGETATRLFKVVEPNVAVSNNDFVSIMVTTPSLKTILSLFQLNIRNTDAQVPGTGTWCQALEQF
ncbi:hypothetical protein GCM10008983_09860 [Lentibacillus halophilus]|uniref:Uncharacterized protein n=1 Tax=Lentibacillus halophilus TaxID=295065 RepID=A0ABP3IZY7_9BACI